MYAGLNCNQLILTGYTVNVFIKLVLGFIVKDNFICLLLTFIIIYIIHKYVCYTVTYNNRSIVITQNTFKHIKCIIIYIWNTDLLALYICRRILYIIILMRFNFCIRAIILNILWMYNILMPIRKKKLSFFTTWKIITYRFFVRDSS